MNRPSGFQRPADLDERAGQIVHPVQGEERHRQVEALAGERQPLLVAENAPRFRHRRETDHRLRTPAPAQGLGRGRRRRAHVEGKGKGPQHRGEPLLQVLDRAGEEKIGIALLERPRQAAADEGTVEDERRAHEALDMARVGRRSKGFFCSTRCHPRRTKCGKGIS